MVFSIEFIKKRIEHWQLVLEHPQYFDEAEVDSAFANLQFWLMRLKETKS